MYFNIVGGYCAWFGVAHVLVLLCVCYGMLRFSISQIKNNLDMILFWEKRQMLSQNSIDKLMSFVMKTIL